MGIITAEALYPATYTTTGNEISDLGATRPPHSIILQPSATVFNLTMILSGVLLIAAAVALRRSVGNRTLGVSATALGVGVLGVGIFPGNYATIHPWFSLLAFVAGGVAAVVSARVTDRPFRFLALVFGCVSLAALFGSALLTEGLGDGGTERWIAYPVVLWTVSFGGYLLGTATAEP